MDGIRAIVEIVFSISRTLIVFLRFDAGRSICDAPTSSITSIAIDVIDEVGASQMLLPASKRKKTISVRDIENTISTMARIPSKSVSKTDTEKLRDLDSGLKRVVFGQDAAIDALSAAIKLNCC